MRWSLAHFSQRTREVGHPEAGHPPAVGISARSKVKRDGTGLSVLHRPPSGAEAQFLFPGRDRHK